MDDTYQEKERVVFQQESFPKSSKTGTKVHAFETTSWYVPTLSRIFFSERAQAHLTVKRGKMMEQFKKRMTLSSFG